MKVWKDSGSLFEFFLCAPDLMLSQLNSRYWDKLVNFQSQVRECRACLNHRLIVDQSLEVEALLQMKRELILVVLLPKLQQGVIVLHLIAHA